MSGTFTARICNCSLLNSVHVLHVASTLPRLCIDVIAIQARRLQQIRELERKLEKTRQMLNEEEEVHNDLQSEYLQGLESTMNDKAQQRCGGGVAWDEMQFSQL